MRISPERAVSGEEVVVGATGATAGGQVRFFRRRVPAGPVVTETRIADGSGQASLAWAEREPGAFEVWATDVATGRTAAPVRLIVTAPAVAPAEVDWKLRLLRNAQVHPDGIRLQLVALTGSGRRGEDLRLLVRLTNLGAEPRVLRFSSGRVLHLRVITLRGPEAGREVYRWDVLPEAATMSWDPRSTRDLTFAWTPPLVPGTYRIGVTLLTEPRVETFLDVFVLER